MGGDLKAGLSAVLSLEMNRPVARDSRVVMRHIPFIYTPPNLTQATPSSFAEAVTNIRILSWLLLGALHSTQTSGCLPVPIACSNYIADYIHFVLAAFAEHSARSVVHMSSLFHAFHLCQLWTIYCEQSSHRSEEAYGRILSSILDFWGRVVPAILHLLSYSVLSDMVNLHFIETIDSLERYNSAVLCQLYPMWQPILTANHTHIPSQLRAKLEACENQPSIEPQPLSPWLKKVRYKIAQIELQSSSASPFYNV